MEPSRCFPHTGFSWFTQPSRHLSQNCASNLCKALEIMSHFSTSLNIFFGLYFYFSTHQLPSVVLLLGLFHHPFSQYVLATATFGLLKNSSNLSTPIISRMCHCLFYPSRSFIFVIFDFLAPSTVNA